MNLVYFTIGHNPHYVELLELCLLSMMSSTNMEDTRIMVMCDRAFEKHVRDLQLAHYIMITEANASPEMVSMRKVDVFDFEHINEFDKVLYLDSDLVCLRDLKHIFECITEDDKLYVRHESTNAFEHTLPFFGFEDYTREQVMEFTRNNVHPFNCGHFGFKNTDTMRAHFARVREMIAVNTRPFFYEQSFMNRYFNIKAPPKYFPEELVAISTRGHAITQNTCIVHFANVGLSVHQKRSLMSDVLRSVREKQTRCIS